MASRVGSRPCLAITWIFRGEQWLNFRWNFRNYGAMLVGWRSSSSSWTTTGAVPGRFDMDTPNLPGTAPVVIQDDEEDRQTTNVAAEFLKFHLKFNHCSPRKIHVMAEQGILPTQLVTCAIPVCSACQFGKASKRPWRQKTRRNRAEVKRAQDPDDVISMDQMISRTPGLIAQMAGFLTKDATPAQRSS